MNPQLEIFRKKLSAPIREVFDRVAGDTEGWSSVETTKRSGKTIAVRFDSSDGLGHVTFRVCDDDSMEVGDA